MKNYINSIYLKQDDKMTDIIKVSGKLNLIIEELKKVVNEKGYINLYLAKRKTPSKNQSHYVYQFIKDK